MPREAIKLLVTPAHHKPSGWREALCSRRAAIHSFRKRTPGSEHMEDKRSGMGVLAWAWAQCRSGNCSSLICFQLVMSRCLLSPQMQRSPVVWWWEPASIPRTLPVVS